MIEPMLFGFIPLYSILISLAAAVGLGLSIWRSPERRDPLTWLGIGLLGASLVGGRAGYIVQNFRYYQSHLIEIPQFWLGGMTWAGGLVGLLVFITACQVFWDEQALNLLDVYLPLIGLASAAIWLGDWGSGAGYGPQTESWIGIPIQDIYGNVSPRWPLPIIGALGSMGWTAFVVFYPVERWLGNRLWQGGVGLIGLVAISGIISFFEVDPAPRLWGLKIETWLSLIMVIVGLVIFQVTRSEKNNEKIKN